MNGHPMDLITSDAFSALLSPKGLDAITTFALQIIAGILTIFIGFWLSGRASRLAKESLDKIERVDNTVVPMIGALIRYAGMTLTLVIALGNFGVETTSIIAVLGAAGLAIGLALQGTLSNVAAGLMLVFLRPFKVGDWIEINGYRGIIVDKTVTATMLMEVGPGHSTSHYTGRVITIPNSLFVTYPTKNESIFRKYALHTFAIPLTPKSDHKTAKEILLQAATEACSSYLDEAKNY
ncbi:MAG: hypothetical protein EBT93_15960, partial [Alphaproteobacteria bacterium]|nr:hypothetical protein [Alphaproteobacteria bacterium]